MHRSLSTSYIHPHLSLPVSPYLSHHCFDGARVDSTVDVLEDRSGVSCKLDPPVEGGALPFPLFSGVAVGVRNARSPAGANGV